MKSSHPLVRSKHMMIRLVSYEPKTSTVLEIMDQRLTVGGRFPTALSDCALYHLKAGNKVVMEYRAKGEKQNGTIRD